MQRVWKTALSLIVVVMDASAKVIIPYVWSVLQLYYYNGN